MQWLSGLWAGDNHILQFAAIAACAIAVLVALAIVYRVVFANRLRVPGARTRQPRLGLVDAFSLDGQRQLVLVRRDNVEHLVMIGGPNDVLLESQINRGVPASREPGVAAPRPAAPLRRRTESIAPAPEVAAAQTVETTPAAEIHPLPIRSAPRDEHAEAAPSVERAVAAGARPAEAARLAVVSRPKPAPAQRTMPPPIAPLGRANFVRLPDKNAPPQLAAAEAPLAETTDPERSEEPQIVAEWAKSAEPSPGAATSGKGAAAPKAGAPVVTAGHPATPAAAAAPRPDPRPQDARPAAPATPHPEAKAPAKVDIHGPAAPEHVRPTGLAASAPLGFKPESHPRPVRPEAPGPGLHSDAKAGARGEAHAPAAPGPAVSAAPPRDLHPPRPEPRIDAHGLVAPAPAGPPPAPSADKGAANVDDPFAGLDSLEAEMAKLLGREKLD